MRLYDKNRIVFYCDLMRDSGWGCVGILKVKSILIKLWYMNKKRPRIRSLIFVVGIVGLEPTRSQ